MTMNDDQLETWNVKVTADTSDLETKLQSTSRTGRQFANTLVSAFDDIAIKGKNVGDVFKSLALNLSQLALKTALQPLTSDLASVFQGVISGATPFAKGGVIQAGTPVPFASGGVIASPISFPLAGGATGLAGERGPEAIMPLTRGSDGRLGVAMSGGGGQQITINISTPDVQSFGRSQSQIAAMIARAAAAGQRNL
ncbi:phage tail tape measure protein [Hyphomicrobium facile]|uniref:Phage tail tape measure protein, lambda family n=1 Tax=Hyphomicrobium facile TaxID=51670 RepID=A0A1I7NWZ3_9HYPH|nr:phage tail tape measure protein [Hyphomicrobium facile]SFV39186.1 phage tail tape measure protein, lambda family [Hyphomicrobium facile]